MAKPISVETYVQQFFPAFDAVESLKKMKDGKNWNETHKYYGQTDERILSSWKTSRERAQQEELRLRKEAQNFHSYSNQWIEKYFQTVKKHELKVFEPFEDHVVHLKVDGVDLVEKQGDAVELIRFKRITPMALYKTYNNGLGKYSNIENSELVRVMLELWISASIYARKFQTRVKNVWLVYVHDESSPDGWSTIDGSSRYKWKEYAQSMLYERLDLDTKEEKTDENEIDDEWELKKEVKALIVDFIRESIIFPRLEEWEEKTGKNMVAELLFGNS